MSIILLLLLSIVGAIFYRMGGSSKYNTKVRDFGVPCCVLLYLIPFSLHNYASLLYWCTCLLSFGLTFGAQTTYWKKKGEETKWWNWALVGLANGLSILPFVWYTGNWLPFLFRTVFLTVCIVVWSERVDNVVWEEGGRGALIVGSLWLLT